MISSCAALIRVFPSSWFRLGSPRKTGNAGATVAAAYARTEGIRQIGVQRLFDNSAAAVTRQTPRWIAALGRRLGPREGLGQSCRHFLIRRKTARRPFRKGRAAVHDDLENAATAFAQGNQGGWVGLQDQVPCRYRTRFIASHAAVFDFYPHLLNILCRLMRF